MHVRAICGARVHVDAAGDVDGDHRGGHVLEQLGRVGPQRPRAGNPDDAVDHQIGYRRNAFDDPAAGRGERGQRLRVRALRFEQDRRGRCAPTTQKGGRPQCVAAVVTGADDRAHPATGDTAGEEGEFARNRGGQSMGGAAHKGTAGQARQQRSFGFPDRVGGVVVPHRLQETMLARICVATAGFICG
jgi:hypothetical protein